MPAYYYENLPISTLFNYIRKGTININPEYQRGIVWDDTKRVNLIRTLLEGFPMPSINFVENSDPSQAKFECMDGKNRLTAIERYMKGEISVDNIRFEEFSEDDKEDFRSINVQVCIFKNLGDDQRREYFRRIQEGVSLTQTEIIWSLQGIPIVDRVRNIHETCLKNIDLLWKTDRYSDLTLLLNLGIIFMEKNISRACAGHSTALTNWVKKSPRDGHNFRQIEDGIKLILQRLVNLLTVMPNEKAKPWVVMDIARILVYKNFKGVTEEKVVTFVTELDKYMVNNEETEIEAVAEYAEVISKGASSHQYTCKNFERRFEILKKIF